MAYTYPSTGKHGGGFDPSNGAFVQSNSYPSYPSKPAHCGGGNFDPSNPFVQSNQTTAYPTQSGHCGGGNFDPAAPFANTPVAVQPSSVAAPVYKPQFNHSVQLLSLATPTTAGTAPGNSHQTLRLFELNEMALNDVETAAYEVHTSNTQPQYSPPQSYKNAKHEPEAPLRNRTMEPKGYAHLFDTWTSWKWEFPNAYRKPGLGYQKIEQHRHRDWFDREWVGDYDDRYISSWDGKVSKLVVQTVDDIYDNNTAATYRRTFIRNIAPIYLRLANWPFNHVDPTHNDGKPTDKDMPMLCAKWFFAALAITIFISSPTSAQIAPRNNGAYDPVPYRYVGYPKVARNALELDVPASARETTNPISERLLRPRYLCFLRDPGEPALIMGVEAWMAQNPGRDVQYVFVAYTAEQFKSPDDLMALHQMADAAARNAGVAAYWVGCSCMPEPSELQEDVYRICDVIRGATSLAIAVGCAPDNPNINTPNTMLQQWGQRIWTFPEVLLAPAGRDIMVYVRGSDPSIPLSIPKNQFAARVWLDDAHIARQLIDHYEGNLILSQLELVTLALSCLHRRSTTQYLPGDHSYALMGLLRVRPKIDTTDSAFQAFARLSLANNSDQLLERLICILPTSPSQPWHSTSDAYAAHLWDILPQDCSIAGIGHDDTIILDGARAASVRWKSFTPVATTRRPTWKRTGAEIALRLSGLAFFVAISLIAAASASIVPNTTLRAIGVMLLIYSLSFIALSPWLLRILYLGKFWDQQCWLFGFEGYMPLETIEAQIFGGKLGRLRWSAFASPLSRHHRNEHDECVADDPTSDPYVAALVDRARHAGPGDMRLFSLVDTGSMTVTLFEAERPPTAFIMAGSEGGMKRVVGCSYDWASSTMVRETVLRMETRFEDMMVRVGRVKMGFRRVQRPVGEIGVVGEAKGCRVE